MTTGVMLAGWVCVFWVAMAALDLAFGLLRGAADRD
jgi:hypothetical protein